MHTLAAEHCAGAVDHEGQSSLLKINFRLGRFQSSSYLPTNTCAHRTKVRLRIAPICDAPLSRSARCSLAPLQKSRRNHGSYGIIVNIALG